VIAEGLEINDATNFYQFPSNGYPTLTFSFQAIYNPITGQIVPGTEHRSVTDPFNLGSFTPPTSVPFNGSVGQFLNNLRPREHCDSNWQRVGRRHRSGRTLFPWLHRDKFRPIGHCASVRRGWTSVTRLPQCGRFAERRRYVHCRHQRLANVYPSPTDSGNTRTRCSFS
jgi:hypothetical protein